MRFKKCKKENRKYFWSKCYWISHQSDRPSETDNFLENNEISTIWEIRNITNIQIRRWKSFTQLDYVCCFRLWLWHKLQKQPNDVFLQHIRCLTVTEKSARTDDEKWILYNNQECKRSWSKHNEFIRTGSLCTSPESSDRRLQTWFKAPVSDLWPSLYYQYLLFSIYIYRV